MYGGSDDAAKARYIADVGGQGETSGKANARGYAGSVLGKGVEYDPQKDSANLATWLEKSGTFNTGGN